MGNRDGGGRHTKFKDTLVRVVGCLLIIYMMFSNVGIASAALPTGYNWGPTGFGGLTLGKQLSDGVGYYTFDHSFNGIYSSKFEVKDASGWRTEIATNATNYTITADRAIKITSGYILDPAKVYRMTFWDASGNVHGGPSYWPSTPLGIPSAPTGVQVTGFGTNNGSLSWNPNPSSEQVTLYKIYHGSTLLGSTSSTSYNFTGLSIGSHTMYITAVNSIGESIPSQSVSYTVLDIPSQVTGLTVTGSGDSGTLSWNPNPENEQVSSYKVYDGEVLLGSTSLTSYSFSSLGVGSHTLYVRAVNIISEGPKSQGLPYLVALPEAPSGLSAGNISTTGFSLYWLRQSDAESYNVYLDGSLMGNVSQPLIYNPSYNVSSLQSGSTHTIVVTAVNQNGESAQSQPVTVTLLASAPSGLQVSNITTTSVDISWSIVTEATSYAVYADGNQIATTDQTNYTVTGLTPNTTYSFQVASVNSSGQSDLSSAVNVTMPDIPPVPPAVPTGLSAANITTTSFTVYWLKQFDASSYNVYLDGSLFGNVSQPLLFNPSYDVTGLQPGSTHTVTVIAVNQYGESSSSEPLNVTTIQPVPPAAPTGLSAGNITTTSFTVYWLKVSGADSYNVYLDGSLVGNVSQTILFNPSYDFTGLGFGSTHTVTLTAVNQYGESLPAQPLSVTTTVPRPALQISIDNRDINLSWSGAQGVTTDKYLVMVNGSQVASTTATQYTVTEEPGSYQLQVIEVATDGNQYSSNLVTATVSALSSVSASTMTANVLQNVGTVMIPMGGLLALALAIKGSPLLIAAVKMGLLNKWFR